MHHLASVASSILAEPDVDGTASGFHILTAPCSMPERVQERHLAAWPDVAHLTVNTDLVLAVIARDVFPFGHYLTS